MNLNKRLKRDIEAEAERQSHLEANFGDAVIVAAYMQMSLTKLEWLREKINAEIKRKKEYRRVNAHSGGADGNVDRV